MAVLAASTSSRVSASASYLEQIDAAAGLFQPGTVESVLVRRLS